jgi:hypothetical protein
MRCFLENCPQQWTNTKENKYRSAGKENTGNISKTEI